MAPALYKALPRLEEPELVREALWMLTLKLAMLLK
jgi:hypothetical protein